MCSWLDGKHVVFEEVLKGGLSGASGQQADLHNRDFLQASTCDVDWVGNHILFMW